MKLVLHNYWRSSASYRVRIGLGLKRLSFEYVAVNVLTGEQGAEAYRARNPMAQVPTLEIIEVEERSDSMGDGNPAGSAGRAGGEATRGEGGQRIALTQSLAILEYLDERWPEPAILPRDRYLRAKARQLAEIVNSGIQPMQNSGTVRRVKALGGNEADWMRPFIADGLAAFARSAAETAGSFCVGDAPSIADICMVPQIASAHRFNVPLDPVCDRLLEIEARCLALPAFADATPDRQPDAVKS
jgi:maleylpyruvate isomerase